MGIVEDQDPTLFEELSLKRKWSHVSKDPSKGLKDEVMNQNSYWSQLNHLPAKGVERIVTERILNYDKDTCDLILQKILLQKRQADLKKDFMQRNRQELRAKLRHRHNQVMELEQRCGVRLGMGSKTQRFSQDGQLRVGADSIDFNTSHQTSHDVSK